MSGSAALATKVILSYSLYDGDFMKFTDFCQNLSNLCLQCPRYADILNGTAVPPTLASVSELGASYIADSSFSADAAAPTSSSADASDDVLSDSLNIRAPRTPAGRTSTSDISIVQIETLKMNTNKEFKALTDKWDILLQEASELFKSLFTPAYYVTILERFNSASPLVLLKRLKAEHEKEREVVRRTMKEVEDLKLNCLTFNPSECKPGTVLSFITILDRQFSRMDWVTDKEKANFLVRSLLGIGFNYPENNFNHLFDTDYWEEKADCEGKTFDYALAQEYAEDDWRAMFQKIGYSKVTKFVFLDLRQTIDRQRNMNKQELQRMLHAKNGGQPSVNSVQRPDVGRDRDSGKRRVAVLPIPLLVVLPVPVPLVPFFGALIVSV
jgi:hypothetical protein